MNCPKDKRGWPGPSRPTRFRFLRCAAEHCSAAQRRVMRKNLPSLRRGGYQPPVRTRFIPKATWADPQQTPCEFAQRILMIDLLPPGRRGRRPLQEYRHRSVLLSLRCFEAVRTPLRAAKGTDLSVPPALSFAFQARSFRSRTRSRMSTVPSPFRSAAAGLKAPSAGKSTSCFRSSIRSRLSTSASSFMSPGS